MYSLQLINKLPLISNISTIGFLLVRDVFVVSLAFNGRTFSPALFLMSGSVG